MMSTDRVTQVQYLKSYVPFDDVGENTFRQFVIEINILPQPFTTHDGYKCVPPMNVGERLEHSNTPSSRLVK